MINRKCSVEIGEISQLVNGHAFKPKDWNGLGLPIVRIQNLNDENKPYNYSNKLVPDKHVINSGDVLLSWSGTPGTSFGCFIWDRGKALLNQHIFKVLVDNSRMDDSFFMYAVNSRLDEMISKAHGGVGLRHITKKKLETIKIPCPEIHEQRLIVIRVKELLERVDEVHQLRQKSVKEALNLEGAVFADFVLNNFNGDKEGSIVPLSKILERTQYGTSKKANTKDHGLPVLRMGNIQGGHLDTTNLKYIDLPEKEEKKYLLQEGDILFNRTNSLELVGKAATFTGLKENWVFASYLIRLEVNRCKALPEYVTAVINSRIGKEFVYRTARRAIGMVNINAKQIQDLQIPLPSIPAQTKLVELMHEARNVAESIRGNLDITPISSLQQSILHNAFGGKL